MPPRPGGDDRGGAAEEPAAEEGESSALEDLVHALGDDVAGDGGHKGKNTKAARQRRLVVRRKRIDFVELREASLQKAVCCG